MAVPHKHGCIVCGQHFDCPCPALPDEVSTYDEAVAGGWPTLCLPHEADAANGRTDWSEFE